MKTRKTKTGANRDGDEGKINYVHVSAIATRVFCEYMHQNRIQSDGKLRAADNWKKGMPFSWYKKSFLGHLQDFKMLEEGNVVLENGKELTLFDTLMGAKFNFDGMIHVVMKGHKFDRKYTNGALKKEFNKRFTQELKKEKETKDKDSI